MDNKIPLAEELKSLADTVNRIAAKVETGEGVNLSAEEHKLYKEKLEELGVNEKLRELREQLFKAQS